MEKAIFGQEQPRGLPGQLAAWPSTPMHWRAKPAQHPRQACSRAQPASRPSKPRPSSPTPASPFLALCRRQEGPARHPLPPLVPPRLLCFNGSRAPAHGKNPRAPRPSLSSASPTYRADAPIGCHVAEPRRLEPRLASRSPGAQRPWTWMTPPPTTPVPSLSSHGLRNSGAPKRP